MLDRIKQALWHSRGGDPASPGTVEGSPLDPTMEVIRQTQLINGTGSAIDSGHFSAVEKRPVRRPSSPPGSTAKRSAGKVAPPTTPFYVPTLRPPTGFLAVFDDGSNRDHELVRLRGGSHTIGREHGSSQLTFPHEVLMSSRHARIDCVREARGYVWQFIDLNSRNGSFFRVQRAMLHDRQEFMIGTHRLVFQMPQQDGSFTSPAVGPGADVGGAGGGFDAPNEQRTQMVRRSDLPSGMPTMARLTYRSLEGEESSFQINRDHIVIGSDPATCALSFPKDRFVCPNHAQLSLTKTGWVLQDVGSRNATWVRLHQARLDQPTEFQLGEQRFYFRPHVPR